MGKHSKNSNDRAFFSYHERKAAAYGRHSSGMLGGHNMASGNFVDRGWGSSTRTLDKDAMKDIDACSLSLQPCADPVVTPQGVLYDKAVIFEYILERKKEIERALKAWEAQQAGVASDAAAAAQQAQDERIEEFVARQEGLSQKDLAARGEKRGGVSASTMGRCINNADTGTHAADTSFWVPQLTPQAKSTLDKPDTTVRCPITAQPLRLKQLYAVKFTRMDEGGKPDVARQSNERYMCPLTKTALNNVNPAAVLRPSGCVVSVKCVEKIIKKDMVDPFTEPPTSLKDKDIILLRVEGTGFAAKTDEKALKVTSKAVVARF
jgi:nitric oxide synthase-interacting protein